MRNFLVRVRRALTSGVGLGVVIGVSLAVLVTLSYVGFQHYSATKTILTNSDQLHRLLTSQTNPPVTVSLPNGTTRPGTYLDLIIHLANAEAAKAQASKPPQTQ